MASEFEIRQLVDQLNQLLDTNDIRCFPQATDLHDQLLQRLERLVETAGKEDRWVLLVTRDVLQLLQRYQLYLKTILSLSSPPEFSHEQLASAPHPPSAKLRTIKHDFEPPAPKKQIWLTLSKGESLFVWKQKDVPKGWAFGRRQTSPPVTGLLPLAYIE